MKLKNPLQVRYGPGWFWFRVFGFGLRFSDRTMYDPIFGEREAKHFGKAWLFWRIGKWSVKILTRSDMR